MSTKLSPPSETDFHELGKEFEEIELGSTNPIIKIQPLPDQLSQGGNQSGTDRRIVTEGEARECMAYSYKTSLKWKILAALWMVSLVVKHSPQQSEPRRRLCASCQLGLRNDNNLPTIRATQIVFI
jgi:hypothetical protein